MQARRLPLSSRPSEARAGILEPEGTEQITLRLPRRVLGHFKSTGKGYQSRISAVLASYVDAKKRAAEGWDFMAHGLMVAHDQDDAAATSR
jgi:hypothetical protein